jgi:hypothetical protein
MKCFSPFTLTGASLLVLLGCGGSSNDSRSTTPDATAPAEDASSPDASTDDGASDDAGDPDAAPRNAACTPTSEQLGTAVNTTHGRLDGTLVYVVPPVGNFDDAGYAEENGFDGGEDGGFHQSGRSLVTHRSVRYGDRGSAAA